MGSEGILKGEQLWLASFPGPAQLSVASAGRGLGTRLVMVERGCTVAEKGHSILPYYHFAVLPFFHSATLPF